MSEDNKLIIDNSAKVFETLHTGTVTALGSMYKWIIASLLAINGGALVALSQQPAGHFLMLQYAGLWFSLGLVAVIVAAFGAMIAAGGAAGLVTQNEPESVIKWFFACGFAASILMPLLSVGLFVGGGISVLKTAPFAQPICASSSKPR